MEPYLILHADQAEQERIRKLCMRLPRRSLVRAAGESLLNGFAPDVSLLQRCVEVLAQQQAPRRRERAVAAWVLGVAPLPPAFRQEAAEALARVVDNFDLHRDAGGRLGRAIWRTMALFACFTILSIFFYMSRVPLYLLTAFFMLVSFVATAPASFIWDHRCTNLVRAEAATALGRLAAPEYLGALARGATDPAERVSQAAVHALHRTLPRVTSELEGRLPPGVGAQLCGVLRRAEPTLSIAILQVLPIVAGAEVIPTVERLEKRARTAEVRAAASAVLPALYARRDRARQAEVLLRPSAAQPATPETLLRPVVNAGTEQELLLRPSGDQP